MYVSTIESSPAEQMYRLIDHGEIDSMPDLVEKLLDTITKLSDYTKPEGRPPIHKVPRAEIERTICHGPCQVKAWYLPDEGIFIDDALTPESDLVHRSILLHELVHFLQDVNAEGASMDDCERWLHREQEAYRLQNHYLSLVGDGASYNMMLANQSWVTTSRTACRNWRRRINTAQ